MSQPFPPAPTTFDYLYKVKEVTHVVDGDTVDLLVDLGLQVDICERFRLLGINAPEVHGASRAAGELSTEWLRSRLLSPIAGGTLYVQTIKVDGFRRWLGTLYDRTPEGFVSINDQMVAAGFAVVYWP